MDDRIQLLVKGKDKETQEEQVFPLSLHRRYVACLYKDQYGIAVSTTFGKIYRVEQTLKELEEQL